MNRENGNQWDRPDGKSVPHRGRFSEIARQLRVSIVATLVLSAIVCGIYPAVVWGLAELFFPHQANGSLIGKDGRPVLDVSQAAGSTLIGQSFSDVRYFHPRPSSAGNGYDATASGGSNLGPTSAKLLNGTTKKDEKGNEIVDFDGIHDRIVHYCVENNVPFESSAPIRQFQDSQGNLDDVKLIKAFKADAPLVFIPSQSIPADAVTGSGSGLDPEITAQNAMLQASRVAAMRGAPLEKVIALLQRYTKGPQLGILGETRVNVLEANLALDREIPMPPTQPSGK